MIFIVLNVFTWFTGAFSFALNLNSVPVCLTVILIHTAISTTHRVILGTTVPCWYLTGHTLKKIFMVQEQNFDFSMSAQFLGSVLPPYVTFLCVCVSVCGQPIFVQRFELVKALFLAVVLAYLSYRKLSPSLTEQCHTQIF